MFKRYYESDTRRIAKALLKETLTEEQIEAIAMICETAEIQGNYVFDGEGSNWEDSASYTLSNLGEEFRGLKKK